VSKVMKALGPSTFDGVVDDEDVLEVELVLFVEPVLLTMGIGEVIGFPFERGA